MFASHVQSRYRVSHRRWFGKGLYCSCQCRDSYAPTQTRPTPSLSADAKLFAWLLAPLSGHARRPLARAICAGATAVDFVLLVALVHSFGTFRTRRPKTAAMQINESTAFTIALVGPWRSCHSPSLVRRMR